MTFAAAVLTLPWLLPAGQATQARPRIAFAPPPPALTYTCTIESRDPRGVIRRKRLWYDRGSFREEYIDQATGVTASARVYKRDGQGLAFLWRASSPLDVQTDIEGIMYRMARDRPEEYVRVSRIPPGFTEVVSEPVPNIVLQSFPPRGSTATYRRVGRTAVDGKPCVLYEAKPVPGAWRSRTVPGAGGQRTAVFKGYVVAVLESGGRLQYRITGLRFTERLEPSWFELPRGATVKVPADLKVKLPPAVRRVEYPGFGIGQPKQGATRVLGP